MGSGQVGTPQGSRYAVTEAVTGLLRRISQAVTGPRNLPDDRALGVSAGPEPIVVTGPRNLPGDRALALSAEPEAIVVTANPRHLRRFGKRATLE
jgi:hypothetical protein